MTTYYITVYERWTHGNKWGYLLTTNNIDAHIKQLKTMYERFTVQER